MYKLLPIFEACIYFFCGSSSMDTIKGVSISGKYAVKFYGPYGWNISTFTLTTSTEQAAMRIADIWRMCREAPDCDLFFNDYGSELRSVLCNMDEVCCYAECNEPHVPSKDRRG